MKTSTIILLIVGTLVFGVAAYLLLKSKGVVGPLAGPVISPPISISKQNTLSSIAGSIGSIAAQSGEKWLENKISSLF